MVKGKWEATGIFSLDVISVAKLYSFMNATISSWSVVKFAFGIYLQIIFALYKVLIKNALA
jgi:hypothetical protein